MRKHPRDARNYVRLAQLFQQEARVTGRHHEYIPKAFSLLDEALKFAPADFEATVTRASLLMTLHQFAQAKELAERAVSENPFNAFSYGVLCDALVELGDYDGATKTCDKMLGIRPDIRSYARASYLRELRGDVEGACAAMKSAAEAGVSGQENRAWALFNLGALHLEMGKPDTAEYIFKGILEERPDYAFALGGLARAEYFKGDVDEAIGLLTRAAEITGEHIFLEQLADIERIRGRAGDADGTAKIVLASFDQHERDGWNVDREYALFCANHGIKLDEALRRARRDYERRPANVDALDTYAWVIYKNGEASKALPLIEQALRLNTRNPDIHFHASMIYQATGCRALAQNHLRIALAGSPSLNPLYAGEIQAYVASSLDLASSRQ